MLISPAVRAQSFLDAQDCVPSNSSEKEVWVDALERADTCLTSAVNKFGLDSVQARYWHDVLVELFRIGDERGYDNVVPREGRDDVPSGRPAR